MTDSTFDASVYPARKHAAAWQLFLVLVAGATLLPFVLAPLAAGLVSRTDSAFLVFSTIAFVGANGHVAATGWFLTDTQMRSHFRVRPLRYIVVPCFLIAASAIAYQLLDGPTLLSVSV